MPCITSKHVGHANVLPVSAVNLPKDCINLGQGYMNFPPPEWAREEAENALRTTEANHYAPAKGKLRLRKAIKEFYGVQFGNELDPETEIIVTSGANEGECVLRVAFLQGSPMNTPMYVRVASKLSRTKRPGSDEHASALVAPT